MKQAKSNTQANKPSMGGKKIEGKYANYFMVGHNAFEFVIDFGQYYAETDKAELYFRIVTSPCYAKELFVTLRDAIEQYEKSFGVIKAR